ncbi:Oidioi.mRNA.OKI2018_I69.chr2.g6561.t1.cds [Oikopleura dioica]|uniref:Oidioi.mRNA.OKI2018_I69.chr2.g6561.t1.cds n=1 Tax=Oikopleura dioica TaxID=34765 RepID=A0ABN7T3V0_OIKDI|nr:Oidioi.mRNA.OKI2018_I69.chr2.g6561.t1.cds [Oikopleura dioica]
MEGVSLINPDGNILFVRSSHGRSVATTQLLTIWSSVLFSQSEAELDPISCITDSLRIYILKRKTHTVICWFDKNVNEYYAHRLTDYADKIILLLLGQDDLVEIADPRLKKDIRLAYPLLDGLICQIDEVPVWLITDFPVYSLSFSKLPEIQKQIDFWSDRLETPYVAIVQDNEIISMKSDFGEQLDYIEINIIAYCASVYSDKALVELPVYLYKLAPDNAYRLILIKLFGNTSMVALCGSVTNLTTIKFTPHDISQLEPLRNFVKGPKGLPPGLIGTLIQDEAIMKTMLYIRPTKSSLMENELTEDEIKLNLMSVFRDTKTQNPTHSEFYSARKQYKSYVLKQDNRHIVFLFSAEVPIYALQQLANKAAPIFE